MAKWGSGSRTGHAVHVPDLVCPVVDRVAGVVSTGALVSLGLSRDGGSLACTVTYDGEWEREWFRDPAQLAEWLQAQEEAILTYQESASSERRPAPQQPVRTRSKRP